MGKIGGKQTLLGLLTMVLATIVALAICEVALRLLHLPRVNAASGTFQLSSDPQLGYELLPGASDGNASISSKGLRDREYSETKSRGTFRIAIIGDSVAFGYKVHQSEAIPKVLERLLNGSAIGRQPIEVLNFGVEGYSSGQIARRMVVKVSSFHPDLVVYLYCLNDPDDGWDDIIERLLAKLDPTQQSMVASQLRHTRSLFSGLRLYSLATAAFPLLRLVRSHGVQFALYGKEPAYYEALHSNQVQWESTVLDIERMGSEAHSIGAGFVGVISPIFHEDGQPYRNDYPLTAVHAQVAGAFRSTGAHVLDLAPVMAKFPDSPQEHAGIDDLHYSVIGHRYVAGALRDFLLRERLVPMEPLETF